MKALEKLHEAVESREKVVLESSKHAHTDKCLQLRMASLHVFFTTLYPDNHQRREMLGMVHKIKGLSPKALEHKE